VVTAYNFASFCLGGKRTPRRDATQICNERKSPGRVARVQGLNEDQVGPGQRPHAHITSAQIGAVAAIQGGQGDKQVCLLASSRAFHRRHSNLPAFLYLKAQGPKRPMRGIMEHAWGWCK